MRRKWVWFFLGLGLSLGLSPYLLYADQKSPTLEVPHSIMWERLRQSLTELKTLQHEQVRELQSLRIDNHALSNQLRESQTILEQQQYEIAEWESSSIQSSRLLESLRGSILDLQVSLKWNRLTWQVGIPTTAVLAFWAGYRVANS